MDYVRNLGAWGNYLLAFVAGALVAYWGGLPHGLQTMAQGAGIIFFANVLTGSVLAWNQKEFSSRGAGKAVRKLITYFGGLLLAHGIDIGLGLGAVCTAAMLLVIFLMEASSVVENLAALGLPVPAVITDKLEALRGRTEETNNDD